VAVTAKTQTILWTRSGGRCQYRGCNKPLLGEALSGRRLLNLSYVAHIVGVRGPRADPLRSKSLENDVGNLMLLCDAHHRLIDREGEADHPEHLLLQMKSDHERRLEIVGGIAHDAGTKVLVYGARVGQQDCPARFDLAKLALLPERYPEEDRAISLEMSGIDLNDNEPEFWVVQKRNLERQFKTRVLERLASGDIKRLSVFALAPQPLLIKLGVLLGEVPDVEVRQLCREPQGWAWRSRDEVIALQQLHSRSAGRRVALKVALSATVSDDRIEAVMGPGVPIWALTTAKPDRDIIQTADDLRSVRRSLRQLFDLIKAKHGEGAEIHVFPAMPVSAAVELGRVWMPKADLPMVVYDQDRTLGGFVERLRIGGLENAVALQPTESLELTHG
jgi:hypothetical protein